MIFIFKQTIRDLYRERILYNVFFLSLFLIFVGYLASMLVFGHQDRVILNFGTSVISLSILGVAITVGSRVIRTEIDQRTIYLPISRPLSRTHYFFGKVAGVSVFLISNLLLLTFILIGSIHYVGGEYHPVLYQWAILTWVESLMTLGLSLVLSFWIRPALNVMTVMTFLFLSHNHEQMQILQEQAEHGRSLFQVLSHLTPDGSIFFLDTRIYYDLPLECSELILRCGYGLLWTVAFSVLANALFFRRNL